MDKILKLCRFVFYPLYFISYFLPRDKKIWLFGAHHNRFAENAKALFIYSSLHVKGITPIWISSDSALIHALHVKGFRAYKRWSLKGIYYSLKGQYYFYNVYSDDINFYTSAGATRVNLWHGIPLKHIEFDVKMGPLSRMFNSKYSFIYKFFKPYIFRNPHHVLSTSSRVSTMMASAFRVSNERCLELGYPRCDILFRPYEVQKNSENSMLKKLELLQKESKTKLIFYMPTWRSSRSEFLDDAIEDFRLLNDTLGKNSITMVIKLHPNTQYSEKLFSNILFLDSKVDIYDIIALSDYLITDYSSIYFDYLLLDREILFYIFDYEEYVSSDREFYFDYKNSTPGKKIYNFSQLILTLDALDDLNYKNERKQLRDELWFYQDDKACMRICDYFKDG